MRVRTSDDTSFNADASREQFEHERMKAWMLEHGWSVAFSNDPEEIYSLVEEQGDDSDFNSLNHD